MDDILIKQLDIPNDINGYFITDKNGKYALIFADTCENYFYDIDNNVYKKIKLLYINHYIIVNNLFIYTYNDNVYSLDLKILFESKIIVENYFNIHKNCIKNVIKCNQICNYDTIFLFIHSSVITLWDMKTNIQKIFDNKYDIYLTAMDDKKIITSGRSTINIFDIKLGILERQLKEPKCRALAVRDNIIAIGLDIQIKIWIDNKSKILYVPSYVNYLFITQKKQLISKSDVIRIWDINSGNCIQIIKNNINKCCCIDYKSDYKIMRYNSDNKKIEILDLITLPATRIKINELTYLNNYMAKSNIKVPYQLIGDFCEYYNNLPIDCWL